MCGIVAWAGKDVKSFSQTKLNMLGIQNEVRGTHSCGITVDGEIQVGVGNESKFRNFLANQGYLNPAFAPVVIGHTRHATGGAHNTFNAHPFGYGNIKMDNGDYIYKMVGVHNGSLKNHDKFIKKYDVVKQVSYKGDNNKNITRDKIDSELLLECIYKSGTTDVLSEYDGAAALVWSDLSEPNVSYFYHGKSREYGFEAVEVEERPLFAYLENKNSMYVSSLKDSLMTIGGTNKTIFQFDHNTVYKITDGNFKKAVKTKIDRSKAYQKIDRDLVYNKPISHAPVKDNRANYSVQGCGFKRPNPSAANYDNIYNDGASVPQEKYKGRIYSNMLRYYRNGHSVTGVHTYIEGYGFFLLGDTLKAAEALFYSLTNEYFYEGEFFKENSKPYKRYKKKAFVPFVHTEKNEIINPPLYYIFDGVLMITYLDYAAAIQRKESGNPFNYEQLSMCSHYPVVDTSKRYRANDAQSILLSGLQVTDVIAPLGCDKIYSIEKGNCVEIVDVKTYAEKSNTRTDKESQLKIDLNGVKQEILALEQDYSDDTPPYALTDDCGCEEETDDSILDELVLEVFGKVPLVVPGVIDRIDKLYPNSAKASKIKRQCTVLLRIAEKNLSSDKQ